MTQWRKIAGLSAPATAEALCDNDPVHLAVGRV